MVGFPIKYTIFGINSNLVKRTFKGVDVISVFNHKVIFIYQPIHKRLIDIIQLYKRSYLQVIH